MVAHGSPTTGLTDARPIDLSAFTVAWLGPAVPAISIDTDYPVAVLSPVRGDRGFLPIKGKDYAIKSSEAGIELTSPEGNVSYVIDGECSCRDFFYRERRCKHLSACLDAGLIPPISPVAITCDELDLCRIFGMA